MAVRLTPDDVALFRWLWQLRVGTLDQLHRLADWDPQTGTLTHADNSRKRWARLATAGYVVPEDASNNRRAYALAEKGLWALSAADGRDQRCLYQRRDAKERGFLEHTLSITEGAVRVVEGVRPDLDLLAELEPLGMAFYTEKAVRNAAVQRPTERYVTCVDLVAGGQRFTIRPDLVLGLTRHAATRLYFFEADGGSERPPKLVEKLVGYAAFQHQETARWRALHPTVADFRVLLVTTTPRRVAALAASFQGQPGAALVRLTTWDRFRDPTTNVVFDPIWERLEGGGGRASVSLLTRQAVLPASARPTPKGQNAGPSGP